MSRGALPVRTLLVQAALAAAVLLPAAQAQDADTRWRDLSPQQRSALAPLERDWAALDVPRRQKWLEIAARYPQRPAAEQARVQARMSEWTRLTPTERGQARLNYQQAREVPAADRQARWEAYQALSDEQRRRLAARAAPTTAATAAPVRPRGSAVPEVQAPAKSNLVPNPAYGVAPRAVAPTVVQAKPGATTTLMSDRRAPPLHQQTGLPKIAATPGFVDSATLQPKRGPQGAAVVKRPEPAAEPKRGNDKSR